eukprot:scaffold399825_cov34-Prasinocladus_malaysianus.AAC.2
MAMFNSQLRYLRSADTDRGNTSTNPSTDLLIAYRTTLPCHNFFDCLQHQANRQSVFIKHC